VRQALGITSGGQLSIKWVERALNQLLNKILATNEDYVIAIDTDSVYVHLGPLVGKVCSRKTSTTEEIVSFLDRACAGPLAECIDSAYKFLADYVNAFEQKMFMKRESICDKAIWTAKKRYILSVWDEEGVRYKEPKVKVSGLEIVKSSTPQICRDKMRQAVKLILTKDENAVVEFIEKFRTEFENLPASDIAAPRGVRGLEKYAKKKNGIPIHVKGALVFNDATSTSWRACNRNTSQ
jgi:DNA polymerase elongation subunit (family B)